MWGKGAHFPQEAELKRKKDEGEQRSEEQDNAPTMEASMYTHSSHEQGIALETGKEHLYPRQLSLVGGEGIADIACSNVRFTWPFHFFSIFSLLLPF